MKTYNADDNEIDESNTIPCFLSYFSMTFGDNIDMLRMNLFILLP